MSTQGSSKLVITGDGIPEVEKLWNGRYRLEFFCDPSDKTEGWYKGNIDKWLPDFGALQDHAIENGWAYPKNSDVVYDDMRLVEASVPFIPSAGVHYVKLTYETLIDAWVQEKDDTTNDDLNGLQRVTRVSVALPGTAYGSVVGTTTITKDGTTLYLGKSEVDETDAKWTLTEEWFEHGELSRNEDLEDAKGAISITNLGDCPVATAGFTAVKKSEDNTQGLPTCTVTFYEDDSELSRSNDYVGSQLAEMIEVFNPTTQPTPTNGSAVLGSKVVSNVDGIPTTRYTFLVPSILSESEDMVGSQKAITIEAFDEIPVTPTGYAIANTQESDVEGIPTKRYTFLKNDVQLSSSEDYVGSQLSVSQQWFNPSADKTLAGYSLASKNVGDFEGIKTVDYRFLKDDVILSESIDLRNNGKLEVRTTSIFNGSDPAPVGFTLISTRESDVEGIPTTTYTHAKGDGQVFVSESAGPNSIPGTTRKTVRAYGAELIPNGVLIESQDIVRDGYTEYVRTTLDGTITGIKFQYPDVATVEVPGTVECTTQAVSEGSVSGTIAITNSTPRRQKQVATVVTVKIDTAMPTASPRAYDLGAISCSVTSVQTKLQSGDGSVATTGTTSQVGYQRNFASSASIQHYVGSYLTDASSTGSVDYQSSEQPYENGGAISVNTADSYSTSTCTGTGATSAEGYATAGIIARDVDVILTALDGTVYYRIVTEETA